MENPDPRTQTLQALDTFIQTQQALLARQRSDIERLERLKSDLHEDAKSTLATLAHEDHSAFRLSTQADLRLSIPNGFHWKAFENSDTTQLRTLLEKTKAKRAALLTPSLVQTSPLSELQAFVKESRKLIVDPVLSEVERSPLFLLPDILEPEDDDPLEVRRHQEREKIMELKRRKVSMRSGGLTLRRPCNNVVYVRDDSVDETMDVDIGTTDIAPHSDFVGNMSSLPGHDSDEYWTTQTGDTTPASTTSTTSPNANAAGRVRKPTMKAVVHAEEVQANDHQKKKKSKSKAGRAPLVSQDVAQSLDPPTNEIPNSSQKAKSETYKQSWSTEEQNLLEQLLEKIPDGEKNRWQKISRAMGGRRTPRQVASRVQKYFEKLKKFGVV